MTAFSSTSLASSFLSNLKRCAVEAQILTGIPASVTIAQGILETGWGASIPEDSHNYFGVKAGSSWNGQTVHLLTYEEVDGRLLLTRARFRVYSSLEAACINHGSVFYNGYYEDALAYRKHPEEFVKRIAGHYATDSRYAHKLLSIIEDNGLKRFDVPTKLWRLDESIVPEAWQLKQPRMCLVEDYRAGNR